MKPYDTVNDDFSKFIMERAVLGMTGATSYGQLEEKEGCNHSGAGTCCPVHGDADCNSSKQNRKEEAEVYWSSKALDQLEEAQSKTLNVEGLKGGQHKIDANKNGKIAAHDFAMLRGRKGKKSMKEMWQLAAEAKAKIEIMPEIDDRDPGNVKKKNEKKVKEESSCGSSKKAKKY